MGRTCIAIDAAVLTASIGVDAPVEADVGAVVRSENGCGPIDEEFGRRRRFLTSFPGEVKALESTAGVLGSSTSRHIYVHLFFTILAYLVHAAHRGLGFLGKRA